MGQISSVQTKEKVIGGLFLILLILILANAVISQHLERIIVLLYFFLMYVNLSIGLNDKNRLFVTGLRGIILIGLFYVATVYYTGITEIVYVYLLVIAILFIQAFKRKISIWNLFKMVLGPTVWSLLAVFLINEPPESFIWLVLLVLGLVYLLIFLYLYLRSMQKPRARRTKK
jgi:hypothetical protein